MGATNIASCQPTLRLYHQPPEIMTKIWTFTSQQPSLSKYRELLKCMHEQLSFELQISWVHKQYLKQRNQWKVICGMQYPQQSLKKHLAKRKQLRQFFIVKQIFEILQLIGYCLWNYSEYLCSHSDILACLFVINQSSNYIKLCNPQVILQVCKIKQCQHRVHYGKIVEQVFQVLLLQKISRVTKRQVERVNLLYQNQELTKLINLIANPTTDLAKYIRESDLISKIVQARHTKAINFQLLDILEDKYYHGSNTFDTHQIPIRESFKEYRLPTKLSEMNNQIAYSIVHENQIDISYEDELNNHEMEQFKVQKYGSQIINRKFQFFDRIKENQEEENEELSHGNQDTIMHRSLLEIQIQSNHNHSSRVFEKNVNSCIEKTARQDKSYEKGKVDEDDQLVWVVQMYNDGRHRYEGFKRNGVKQGKGKYFYDEGVFYQGEWKDDQINGFGRLYYNKEEIAYEGEWKNGQFNGHGVLCNKYVEPIEGSFDYMDFSEVGLKWKGFEGTFKEDDKNGKGILLLSNDQTFKCTWVDNAAEGYGQFETISGDLIIGLWSNNKFCQSLQLSSCSSSDSSRQNSPPFYG